MHCGGRYWKECYILIISFIFLQTLYPGSRCNEGIRAFLTECRDAGRSEASAHFLYVNGQDAKGVQIPREAHLERGASLNRLTDIWLGTWEYINM